jgi:hypothetical protein
MWLTFQEFITYFNTVHMCKIFSNEQYKYYCIKGEWKDKTAGGPMNMIRENEKCRTEAHESLITSTKNVYRIS